jgi:hypothetical protein
MRPRETSCERIRHKSGTGRAAQERVDAERAAGTGRCARDATGSVDASCSVVAQNAARRAQAACGVETISTRVFVEVGDDGMERAFLDEGARSSSIIDAARARSSGWGRCPYGGSIIAPRLRFWRRFG